MKEFRFAIEEIIKSPPEYWSCGIPVDAVQITRGYCSCDEFGENIKEVVIDEIVIIDNPKNIKLNNNICGNYDILKKRKENIFSKLINKILQKDYIDATKV